MQSPSKLVSKSLKAQNATVAILLMSWGSMAFPILKMQATSLDIQPSPPSKKVIDVHWSPLYPGAWQMTKGGQMVFFDFGLLVKRPKPSMGCNSCGHFCLGPLRRHCQRGKFCDYIGWGCKMPKVPWPTKQLPLSTSCNRGHWCEWQVHCTFFEKPCKETCWYVWWP